MAIVVDASALAFALLGRSSNATELRRRISDDVTHAPHLVDAEVGNVLRRQVLRGELSAAEGQVLLRAGAPLIDYRYEMTGALARAAWALRDNFSFYDALYAALAHTLGCPLLTADQRLARSSVLPCIAELVADA